jgi:hypothetical protein
MANRREDWISAILMKNLPVRSQFSLPPKSHDPLTQKNKYEKKKKANDYIFLFQKLFRGFEYSADWIVI